MKSSLGDHAATTLEELEAMVRWRLRNIQRRPDLINAFLGQAGLTLDPPPALADRPWPFNLCKYGNGNVRAAASESCRADE
jgi:hypothetical protein